MADGERGRNRTAQGSRQDLLTADNGAYSSVTYGRVDGLAPLLLASGF